MMRALFLVAAFVFAGCAPSAADAPIAEQWRGVDVRVTPVELGAETVGRLRFRGGLEIDARHDAIGGLSGLEVLDNNRIVAISDDGRWFEARLVLDDSGTLTGLVDVRTAFMRDENGEPFPNKRSGDSEDLAQLPDGRFAVSFEQTQTIRIYDLNRDGPFGAAIAGPPLDHVERLPNNAGLEALTATPNGSLLAGAEGEGHATTPLWRAPLDEDGAPILMSYPLERGFSLTSLDRLPDGGYVALERFYAPVIGARARITRFSESALNTGAETLSGVEELAALAPPLAMDNFEGISATRGPNGLTRIYIVSDNNFSGRQRTLLMAFDLVEN